MLTDVGFSRLFFSWFRDFHKLLNLSDWKCLKLLFVLPACRCFLRRFTSNPPGPSCWPTSFAQNYLGAKHHPRRERGRKCLQRVKFGAQQHVATHWIRWVALKSLKSRKIEEVICQLIEIRARVGMRKCNFSHTFFVSPSHWVSIYKYWKNVNSAEGKSRVIMSQHTLKFAFYRKPFTASIQLCTRLICKLQVLRLTLGTTFISDSFFDAIEFSKLCEKPSSLSLFSRRHFAKR